MMTVTTRFEQAPKDRKRLEHMAEHRAMLLDESRGYGYGWTTDTDQLVVNMLRHEYSDYDRDQSQEAHREVCLAIARRFPWLAVECDRQIAKRVAQAPIPIMPLRPGCRFTRLPDGTWGIRGQRLTAGQEVEVGRRGGDSEVLIVGAVLTVGARGATVARIATVPAK